MKITTADKINPILIKPVAIAAALYGGTENRKKMPLIMISQTLGSLSIY